MAPGVSSKPNPNPNHRGSNPNALLVGIDKNPSTCVQKIIQGKCR